MKDRYADHAPDVVRMLETNLAQLREVLKYITEIGGSLRLRMDTDTLLQRVSEATRNALRFRYATLYLADGMGNFQARATSGIHMELEDFLRQSPIPEHILNLLISDEFRISDSYLIPVGAPIWQNRDIADLFVIVDEKDRSLSHPTPLVPQPGPCWHQNDLLIVPLFSGDNQLLGFLNPDEPLDGLRPTTDTIGLIEMFANQAAVVIEGTGLYEEVRRSSEERAAIVEIGRALSAPGAHGDLQKIYQTIYEQVERMMSVDAFYIAQYARTPNGEKLILDYIMDGGVRYPPKEFGNLGRQTRYLLFNEPVGRLISTVQEYLEFREVDLSEIEKSFLIGSNRTSESFLFVPIRYGEAILGLLSVQSYKSRAYKRRHLEILKEVAVQAGIAMNNARLYTDLREALKQAQESDRLKNHFLMTASHELRTPLTAIQGYLELLGDFGDALDDESKSRFVNNARRACEELVLLLGNVMDASRIDHDRVLLKLGAVRVVRTVALILEILEPILVREDRTVQVKVDDELLVWADDLRLRQVLLNIVGNALKYTPVGSGVEISAAQVDWDTLCEQTSAVECQPPRSASGQFVIIAVRDWGPGVLFEDQPRLFTKFMRLTSAINSVQRGAGLGLYLCRQLTEAMGGSIWMESKGIPGEGSTFFIALPLYIE